MALQYGTVTGTFLGSNGAPLLGYVLFTPAARRVLDDDIVPPAAVTAKLDLSGSITAALIATDDFTYTVRVVVHAKAGPYIPVTPFSILVLAGGTLDLARYVPVDESTGIPITRGASAYEVWLTAGNSGTVDDFLESLRGPAGSGGGASSSAEYVQALPMATWTIPHSLGRRPSVTLYDQNGEEFDSHVVSTPTLVVASHPSPITGSAVLT